MITPSKFLATRQKQKRARPDQPEIGIVCDRPATTASHLYVGEREFLRRPSSTGCQVRRAVNVGEGGGWRVAREAKPKTGGEPSRPVSPS